MCALSHVVKSDRTACVRVSPSVLRALKLVSMTVSGRPKEIGALVEEILLRDADVQHELRPPP